MGYYDNKTSTALQCPEGCSVCISEKVCTNCIIGYLIVKDGLCYIHCP